MAKAWAKQFYNSKEWQRCKAEYLKQAKYLCEICGETADIVHHKIHLTPDNITNPEITLSHNNLQCVCIQCHNLIHETEGNLAYKKKKKKIFRNYFFDEFGRIAPLKNEV